MTDRVIVLLDMDCFYVQVEERDNSFIKGQPAAVVQYNAWKGGGIIAVNYEARACGVKRGMRGDDAKEKCPTIHLVTVPVQRGKSDLTKYRNAGSEVISVLCQFTDLVERASIDEAYIDLSKIVNVRFDNIQNNLVHEDFKSTWVVGYNDEDATDKTRTYNCKNSVKTWLDEIYNEDDQLMDNYSSSKEGKADQKLAIAAMICEEMRAKILESTGFKCSAGISHNKILGKLACGLHKPNQQTILPMKSVPGLWAKLPISNIRNLGGKLGDSLVDDLKCKTMGDLSIVALTQLQSRYDEKTANWLYSIGKGIDKEPVTARLLAKSIGCGKNFVGKESLILKEKVYNWMKNLSDELSERLEEDKRKNLRLATTLTVHIRMDVEDSSALSRSTSLHSYKTEVIAKIALNLIQHTNTAPSKSDNWIPAITNISLSAGKFRKLITGNASIRDLFNQANNSSSRCINKRLNLTVEASNDSFNSQLDMFSDDDITCIDDTVDTRGDACSLIKETADMTSCASTFDHDGTNINNSNYDTSKSNTLEISALCESPKSPCVIKKNTRTSFSLNHMTSNPLGKVICSQNKETPNVAANNSLTIGYEEPKANERDSISLKSNNQEISSACGTPKSPVIAKKGATNSFFLNYMASKGLVFNDDFRKPVLNQNIVPPDAKGSLLQCEEDIQKVEKRKSYFNEHQFSDDSASNDCEFFIDKDKSNTNVDESAENEPDIQIINAVINKQTSHCRSRTVDESNKGKFIKHKKIFESNNVLNSVKNSLYQPLFSEQNCEATSSVNIYELFPDLSNIDQSVVALLPQNIQKDVARAVKAHNSQLDTDSGEELDTLAEDISRLYDDTSASSGGPSRIKCKTCNIFVPSDMLIEHSDYHFAVNLRKQQMEETRKEILSHGKKTKEIPLQKNKRLKTEKKNVCKMPKIDSFFRKSNQNS